MSLKRRWVVLGRSHRHFAHIVTYLSHTVYLPGTFGNIYKHGSSYGKKQNSSRSFSCSCRFTACIYIFLAPGESGCRWFAPRLPVRAWREICIGKCQVFVGACCCRCCCHDYCCQLIWLMLEGLWDVISLLGWLDPIGHWASLSYNRIPWRDDFGQDDLWRSHGLYLGAPYFWKFRVKHFLICIHWMVFLIRKGAHSGPQWLVNIDVA